MNDLARETNMAERFRLALVGAGMIVRGSHLPAAMSLPSVEVAAIVDPVRMRAAALARDYGLACRVSDNLADVLDGIDGAVIATPNGTHADLAIQCLDAGVSVLIEKPMAVTTAQCDQINAAADRNGKVVAMGYSTRFRPSTLLMKRLLDDGHFGVVRRFVHQYGTAGGWAPISAYNLDRNASGGGVMVVTGTHFLDRMLHFFGMPIEVRFEDDAEGGPEANCRAHFRFKREAGEIEGVAVYSKTCSLPSGMVIDTDRGRVVMGDYDAAEIQFTANDEPSIIQVLRSARDFGLATFESVFQAQLEDFRQACVERRKPLVDGLQGRDSVEVLERLYASRTSIRHAWRPRLEEAA